MNFNRKERILLMHRAQLFEIGPVLCLNRDSLSSSSGNVHVGSLAVEFVVTGLKVSFPFD